MNFITYILNLDNSVISISIENTLDMTVAIDTNTMTTAITTTISSGNPTIPSSLPPITTTSTSDLPVTTSKKKKDKKRLCVV